MNDSNFNLMIVGSVALGLSLLLLCMIIVFVYRKDGRTIFEIFMKGSFIFRELELYIQSSKIKMVKALSNAGVAIIMIAFIASLFRLLFGL